MKTVLSNANQLLEEKIQKAIHSHKIEIEENLKSILRELQSNDSNKKCSEVEYKIEDCVQKYEKAKIMKSKLMSKASI